MREILFRGKRVDNGEFVEGYLLKSQRVSGAIFIVTTGLDPDNLLSCLNKSRGDAELWSVYQVDPATVGQYTGLTTAGKRIFEGDVYKYFDDEIQVVEWSEEFSRIMLHSYGEHEVKRGRKKVKVKHDGWCDLEDYPLEEMECLGNVHDNPELIGGDGHVGEG